MTGNMCACNYIYSIIGNLEIFFFNHVNLIQFYIYYQYQRIYSDIENNWTSGRQTHYDVTDKINNVRYECLDIHLH